MVQTKRGTITWRWLLKLGFQVKVKLRLSVLQVGFDLWCRYAAAHINNTLYQSRPWHRRCEAYLVKLEAWYLEAELDLPVRQCQRATPTDLGLRQAYVQLRQIESLRGQTSGQAYCSPGPSCDPHVGLQALECAVKTLWAPLPSRLHEQILHL
jgi:hypothetical protein